MMEGWDLSNIILAITGAIIVVLAIVKIIHDRKHIVFMPKLQKTNRRKENKLLNALAEDVKQNADNWIPIAYNMMEMKDASVVNDKKNMAIVMAQEGDTVAVKINIKSTDKYRENDTDVLVTHISGPHVRKFKQKIDGYIDSRGKELNFFEDMLNKKL